MAKDVDDFKFELGRELAAAAHRRYDTNANPNRWRLPPLALAASTVAVVVVAALALTVVPSLVGSEAAEANALQVTVLEDRVEIDMVDVVRDPDGLSASLADKYGLQVSFKAEPSDEQLVGHVVSALVITGQDFDTETDADGRVQKVVLPRGFAGQLEIHYGRRAEPGEEYLATTVSPVCADLFNQTPAQSLDRLLGLAPTIRIHAFAADGTGMLDIEPSAVPAHYRLSEIMALSDDSYLATYSEDPFGAPVHPNCE